MTAQLINYPVEAIIPPVQTDLTRNVSIDVALSCLLMYRRPNHQR